ncbi:MAG TPA: hypothetical protein VFA47_12385 [Candidatus Manganitrophaceae bacterium]|nr:hypothetical protein [Candidatus Manganitrophaceae bacterium]
MKKDRLNRYTAVLGLFVLGLFGCAHTITVKVPPKIDLTPYQTIGIVEFSSASPKATPELSQLATQKFMNDIQSAQPQVRFLELGPEGALLKTIGRERMDLESAKAIGKKYGVATLFSGSYEISDVKPKLNMKDLASLNASADVHLSMVSKQWETATGATMWTHSRRGEWQVASLSRDAKTPVSLSVSRPEEQYGKFIAELAFAMTDDFRPHFEQREAPKN